MKKIILSLCLVGVLLGFAPVAKAEVQSSQQDIIQIIEGLKQELIKQLLVQIADLQRQINEILAQQSQVQNSVNPQQNISNQEQPSNEVNNKSSTQSAITETTQSSIDPLAFIENPKLVWKTIGYEYNDLNKPINRLSYITWKTNRQTKLILGPVLPNPTPENPDDWTTKFNEKTKESCPNGYSMEENDICTLKFSDEYGNILEYSINVKTESAVKK